MESLTRVIAPSLGGVLLAGFGAWAPGLFGALLLAGLSVYVWATVLNHLPLGLRPELKLAAEPSAVRE